LHRTQFAKSKNPLGKIQQKDFCFLSFFFFSIASLLEAAGAPTLANNDAVQSYSQIVSSV
jgi:hypothetical protein